MNSYRKERISSREGIAIPGNELSEILRQLSSMNEFLAGCIREHIAKSEKGVRHFSPSLLAPVYEAYFRYPGENGVSRAEIIIRDVLENYFLTSFFCSVTTHGETPLRFWV